MKGILGKQGGGLHIIDPISRPSDVDDLKMWGPFMVGVPKKKEKGFKDFLRATFYK